MRQIKKKWKVAQMNEKKVCIALKEFCQNQYWKKYYETAPSSNCKRYIELEFYYSHYFGAIPDYDEFKNEINKLEKEFNKADWLHLLRYSGHNPPKTYYRKKAEETQ